MEEGGVQPRYVKLTRKQAEVIRPGELNQPIHVPQVSLSLIHALTRMQTPRIAPIFKL